MNMGEMNFKKPKHQKLVEETLKKFIKDDILYGNLQFKEN